MRIIPKQLSTHAHLYSAKHSFTVNIMHNHLSDEQTLQNRYSGINGSNYSNLAEFSSILAKITSIRFFLFGHMLNSIFTMRNGLLQLKTSHTNIITFSI